MSDTNTTPLFTPFTWFHNPSHRHTETFISNTRDIAYGLETVLQLLEHDWLEKIDGGQPILDSATTGNLRRLAIASIRMLGENAEREIAALISVKHD